MTTDCAIRRDEFVAGFVSLVGPYQLSYCGHILFCVWAPIVCHSAVAVLSVGTFLKTNISQGSVATSFRCGGICNRALFQIFC